MLHKDSYQVDVPSKKRGSWTKRIITLCLVVILVGGGLWLYKFLQPETSISQTQSTQTTLSTPNPKTFTELTFSIQLPKDWMLQTSKTSTATYQFRGQKDASVTRSLEVYVDSTPANLAVNRLLPLEANGTTIRATAQVSDNCTSFTSSSKTDPQTGVAPATWKGVKFWCDMANYQRNLVGVGSSSGINTVIVTGPSGAHKYFFVYTDHSTVPDYDIFTSAIASFRAL